MGRHGVVIYNPRGVAIVANYCLDCFVAEKLFVILIFFIQKNLAEITDTNSCIIHSILVLLCPDIYGVKDV